MRFTQTLARRAAASSVALAAVITAAGIGASPAFAASSTDCNNRPSDATCTGAQVNINDACWNSSYVVGPTVGGEFTFVDGGWSFRTELRYSTTCHSNFAYTEVVSTALGWYEYSNKVRRSAGHDGGYVMQHGGWAGGVSNSYAPVLSPLVYSPTNAASACFSNRANDQAQCTPAF